jgi:hypothetical protein
MTWGGGRRGRVYEEGGRDAVLWPLGWWMVAMT